MQIISTKKMNIQHYIVSLDENTKSILDLVKQYSPQELIFKKEGECSIADLLEHICISDEKTIKLLLSDSCGIGPEMELYGDEKLKKVVLEYKGGPKITETEVLELKGTIKDSGTFEQVLSDLRNQLKEHLLDGEISVSNRVYRHLYLKEMTVVDWLKYLIYHTQRHMNDIRDSAMEFKKWS